MVNRLQSLKGNFYKKGFILKKRGFRLRCAPSESLRVAIVVPKTLVSKAVQRNKIKRWGRAFFREELKKKTQGDFLVTVLSKEDSYETFKNNLQQVIKEAKRKLSSEDSSFSDSSL